MNVDKFGRHSAKAASAKLLRGIPGQGFKLTEAGNFNLEYKRLCNVADPLEDHDASTRRYVEKTILPRVRGPLAQLEKKCLILQNNVYNCNTKRLTNVAPPNDNLDAANVQFVQREIINAIDKQFTEARLNFKTVEARLKKLETHLSLESEEHEISQTTGDITDK